MEKNEDFERWWAAKNFKGTTPILLQALRELAWDAFQAGVLSIKKGVISDERN
jgi:hypothetical protein